VVGARDGVLSPSGTLLAYVGAEIGPIPPLYVLDLTTGTVQRLTDRADRPHWPSDDRLLFLSSRDGQEDLWEMRVEPKTGVKRSEPVRLTSGLDASAFTVSADGRRMLAVKEKSTTTIWSFPTKVARVDSVAIGSPLTTGDVRDNRPRWSSDEKDIFFESTRKGSLDVWKMQASGGVPSRLTTGGGVEHRPRPSPDGQWVAFDNDGNMVWLMRPDGTGAHAATDWRSRYILACCAGWSPDAAKIAVTLSKNDGLYALGIGGVTAAGTIDGLRELQMPGGQSQYPQWSPDGSAIVYESFTSGGWNLWVADKNGAAPRQLTSLPGTERQASWQKEPLALFFIKDQREVWRLPMADSMTAAGPPVRWLAIPRLRVPPDALDVSRDGTRILVSLAKPESDLWLVERK